VALWRRDPEQPPPGGESFVDTAPRVNRACDRLLRDHSGQTVLVVSHISPIKILLCRALGVPLSTILPAVSRLRLHQQDPSGTAAKPNRLYLQQPEVTVLHIATDTSADTGRADRRLLLYDLYSRLNPRAAPARQAKLARLTDSR